MKLELDVTQEEMLQRKMFKKNSGIASSVVTASVGVDYEIQPASIGIYKKPINVWENSSSLYSWYSPAAAVATSESIPGEFQENIYSNIGGQGGGQGGEDNYYKTSPTEYRNSSPGYGNVSPLGYRQASPLGYGNDYIPTSPAYTPASPAYNPSSPAYNPSSPVNR